MSGTCRDVRVQVGCLEGYRESVCVSYLYFCVAHLCGVWDVVVEEALGCRQQGLGAQLVSVEMFGWRTGGGRLGVGLFYAYAVLQDYVY